MSAAPHPDLVQVYSHVVTHDERYEIYPNACYVLSARLTPAIGVTDFQATLFTSPAPDTAGDDESKIPLYVDTSGRPDDYDARAGVGGSGMFFENGIYAACDATVAGDDAHLQVCYVPRKQFCPAFPYPEAELTECWDEAHNDGKSQDEAGSEYIPIYENFWDFERDNAEEDTGGSGGPGSTGTLGVNL